MRKKDLHRGDELVLYSCSLQKAPARVEDPGQRFDKGSIDANLMIGVERVCSMTCNWDEIKLGQFNSVRRGAFKTKKYYSVDLDMKVEFAADSGVLRFSVWCEGEMCGEAQVDFGKDDGTTIVMEKSFAEMDF